MTASVGQGQPARRPSSPPPHPRRWAMSQILDIARRLLAHPHAVPARLFSVYHRRPPKHWHRARANDERRTYRVRH